MGTRHLTMVQLEGQYRIAQYGQWDGSPGGQGTTILEFLATWDRPKFEENLRKCTFMTEEEFEKAVNGQQIADDHVLSRELGARVLDLVHKSPQHLRDISDFAADSLMCEWAYVIDLDTNTFEVFSGFNRIPLKPKDRFYKMTPLISKTTTYQPVKLLARYALDALPSSVAMVAHCNQLFAKREGRIDEDRPFPDPEKLCFIRVPTRLRSTVLEALTAAGEHNVVKDAEVITRRFFDIDTHYRENHWIQLAQEHQVEGEIEIDEDAVVSESDDKGAYVMAWLWVDGPHPDDVDAENERQRAVRRAAGITQEEADVSAQTESGTDE